ncbi:hypothetical protein Bca4012_008718 [Brassica carinata]
MKSAILFIVSCVVFLLVLGYPEEAKADDRCHRTALFPGKCEDVGGTSCLMDFKRMSPHFDQCSKCMNRKVKGKDKRECHCSFSTKVNPCF